MTYSSIASVITDTSRRNEAAPPCEAYQWCELDHRDPDIAAGLHEMHVIIACGDHEETFLLEITPSGHPRMSCGPVEGEIWVEPDEPTNTFRSISEVYATAAEQYAQFVESMTTLQSHTRHGTLR
ncbi:hypothetical protein [Microbacterium foliorum]|uniref:hypothetical protein n=1 Tax=Microbacterium foliorum TaxID=104336 RepID=UPI0012946F1F|nr:hypothetical protein [Microbacterium foliorum]